MRTEVSQFEVHLLQSIDLHEGLQKWACDAVCSLLGAEACLGICSAERDGVVIVDVCKTGKGGRRNQNANGRGALYKTHNR